MKRRRTEGQERGEEVEWRKQIRREERSRGEKKEEGRD
jgi:hypothetical protein